MVVVKTELFAEFGSISSKLTVARLVSVPAVVGMTSIVTMTAAPLAMVPRLQISRIGATAYALACGSRTAERDIVGQIIGQ